MQRVTRQEWVWVVAVAGLVMAISSVPYLTGYLAQTGEVRFSGALLDRADYQSYLARMWQGYRGEWQFRLLFTPEAHAGTYLQPFYLALGHLARLTGLGLPLIYQAARLVFGFLMLLAIYGFLAYFIESVQTRRVAFFLATTASGLGWLTEVFHPTPAGGISPMDFWLLDGFTYLAVLVTPHFCATTGLLLAIFLLLLRQPQGPDWREVGLAVLASLALGLIHPYGLLLADLLPLLYWGIETLRTRRVVWRGLIAIAAMGVAQAPLVTYDLWVFRTQPIFAAWADQNVTLSPPPEIYLWGYGILLGLAAIGIVARMRHGDKVLIFPLLWIGLVAVLVYLPWNLQRRFLEGIQVPLGLLAGVGLAEGLLPQPEGDRPARWRWLALALVPALMAMSNLYMTTGLTMAAAMRPPAMFWDAGLLAGVDWLGQSSTWDETVLSSFEVGSLIPARIGHRVVLGHGIETKDPEEKQRATDRFFAAATSDDERRELLTRYGIAYIFYSPFERKLGDFDPAQADYLTQVYTNPNVSIYRVTPPK